MKKNIATYSLVLAEQVTDAYEEEQVAMALTDTRTSTTGLMERICDPSNLNQAYKRVKANKGAAGVDRLTVQDLYAYLRTHGETLRSDLLTGRYKPQAVRGVQIPKAGGGKRQLGIPTVVDRVVQQAVYQQLMLVYEPGFSESSYGFRPKRNAHQALRQASEYVASGCGWVVDIDLEKFFDQVNHDVLMGRLAKRIEDKRVLKLIRRYLQAGLLQGGVVISRQAGTPQGGPLSPILSNILLDELDKELERRGHRFCRYADDCTIYVKSEAAGQRVLRSIKQFLHERLRLKVNDQKSGCAAVDQRTFLGYRLNRDGSHRIAPESVQRMRKQVRRLTKRNRGRSLERVIVEVNRYLVGWQNYFKLARNRDLMRGLDEWIRRRLRCYRLKQRKRRYAIATWLRQLGVREQYAWQVAMSSKGWWRLSCNPVINSAMPIRWFKEQGLYFLLVSYDGLQTS